ncbi:MAG: hypothetical protein JW894_13545 [Bacteroidales bacterium]|nr:hypothetical protein [Bacteroidales bacterium]
MSKKSIILFLIFLFLSTGFIGCSSSEKAATQRRNLMMPEKTDLPRNSKYVESKKKKTYKPKKHNKRKKRR